MVTYTKKTEYEKDGKTMLDNPEQVQGSDTGGVPVEGTPNPEAGVSQETPSQSPQVDVEKVKSEYEQKLAQMSQDLNQVKSSLQRREHEQRQNYEKQIAETQKQLREARMQGMDENQRKAYEAQMQQEEYQSLQSRLEEYERKTQEYEQMNGAQTFFMQKGVPANRLVLNQGYEALVQSGWDWVTEQLAAKAQPAQSTQPSPLKTAPSVITDKSTPSTGTTWAELIAKYGSRENVYRMIEQYELPASVLPPV
jgi:flagellar biosynthesis GTPase FlhF